MLIIGCDFGNASLREAFPALRMKGGVLLRDLSCYVS
jgi:hypothetical protein